MFYPTIRQQNSNVPISNDQNQINLKFQNSNLKMTTQNSKRIFPSPSLILPLPSGERGFGEDPSQILPLPSGGGGYRGEGKFSLHFKLQFLCFVLQVIFSAGQIGLAITLETKFALYFSAKILPKKKKLLRL